MGKKDLCSGCRRGDLQNERQVFLLVPLGNLPFGRMNGALKFLLLVAWHGFPKQSCTEKKKSNTQKLGARLQIQAAPTPRKSMNGTVAGSEWVGAVTPESSSGEFAGELAFTGHDEIPSLSALLSLHTLDSNPRGVQFPSSFVVSCLQKAGAGGRTTTRPVSPPRCRWICAQRALFG